MKIEHQDETEIFINQHGAISITQKTWGDDQIIVIQPENIDKVIKALREVKRDLQSFDWSDRDDS